MSNITWMIAPAGNAEKLHETAELEGIDIFYPDLEDSTANTDESIQRGRENIRNIAGEYDWSDRELLPRINEIPSPYWKDDVEALVPLEPDGVVIPKTDSVEEVEQLSSHLGDLEEEHGIEKNSIGIACTIESPRGLVQAYEIATAADRVDKITLGDEDFAAQLGALRNDEMRYSTLRGGLDYARGKLAVDAAAAGVEAHDGSPFALQDDDFITNESDKLARMGYDGRKVIHTGQIKPILRGFAPPQKEVDRAQKIMELDEAAAEGEEAAIEKIDEANILEDTKLTSSVVEQAKLTLERYEKIGAREDI